MALVRMLLHVTGGRADGNPWPYAGEVLECGDGEAADLVRGGLAAAVDGAETAAEPRTEVPVADDTSGAPGASEAVTEPDDAEDPDSPAVRAEKAAWVAHAIAMGEDANIAATLTKAALIAKYGSGR